jgi:hypothetical protein
MSKEALRSLILSKIELDPVCPDGMDVSVRATKCGTWAVNSIPPHGQHIAYTDCVKRISQIVQHLRAKYDLVT